MKNLRVVILTTILAASLSSCKKETEQAQDTASLTSATKKAITAGSILAVRQSYALLTTEEQQILWDKKWEAVLRNDRDRLSNEQKRIILQIKNFVDSYSISGLRKKPSVGEVFLKANIGYFQKHFSNQQLVLLLESAYFCDDFSIFRADEYLQSMNDDDGETVGDANCTCYYSISCSGTKTCQDGGCTKIAECGITGTSNCTGLCT